VREAENDVLLPSNKVRAAKKHVRGTNPRVREPETTSRAAPLDVKIRLLNDVPRDPIDVPRDLIDLPRWRTMRQIRIRKIAS
jgi:hypothetical protein